MTEPRRPALRYHGGKWRIAPWIISHFPPHTCYVEPFGGAMSVLLRKNPSHLEVYNDIDSEVVLFFRVLREQTENLIRAIELTPFSRAELDKAFDPAGDDRERARRFYVRAWQGRGGPRAQWRTGWRFQKSNARGKRSIDDWNETSHLWQIVQRLKQVQIECDDGMSVIERYDAPDTLFYLDPPYPSETRSERWGSTAYAHEMNDGMHAELARALHQIEGMAIISSYRSAMYEDLYHTWRQVTKTTLTDASTEAVEALWISPNAMAARLPLFAQAHSSTV